MKRRLLLQTFFAMLFTCVWAQAPNGTENYYQNADGLCGAELKTALFNIIKITKDDVVAYKGLNEKYKLTDKRADGYLRDWYSNITNYTWDDAGGNSSEGAGWNKEHTVPQSWFGEASPMKSDIVHVVPTDCYVNNRRSSYPFGEVSKATYTSANNYCLLGSSKTPGYSGTVFEPNNEIKGDLARIYFYMATCYEDKCTKWSSGSGSSVFSDENLGLKNWVVDMMMAWSKLDPVDEVEIARNNAIPGIQTNRNPFVDYPGLEDYIWGDKQDVPFSYDNYNGGEQNYVARPVITPDAGTYYESVDVTISCRTEGASIYYTLKGEDASEQSILYEGPITLDVYGTYEIRAIAIKDGNRSAQASATYTVKEQPQPGDDVEIALNNAFFGITTTSTIAASISEDFVKEENGVTFIYALGTGQQRYANANEIRLYKNNKLTVSVASGTIVGLDFTIGDKNSELSANTGVFNGFSWTGDAKEVEITSAGNTALRKVVVKLANGASGIDMVETDHHQRLDGYRVIYDLSGRRVTNPTRGLYIVDGRKVFIP
jgi:endonuclease I